MAAAQRPRDIDWDRLDKTKFLVLGVVSFSGVTTVLYPLTVLKTVQQAATEAQSTAQTTLTIWRSGGLPAFYRGYATVVLGTMPARVISLTSLEATKSAVAKSGQQLGISETALAGSANFLAGGVSSLVTQLITVPRDVISQRQMVHAAGGVGGSGGGGGGGGSGGGGAAAAAWPVHRCAEPRGFGGKGAAAAAAAASSSAGGAAAKGGGGGATGSCSANQPPPTAAPTAPTASTSHTPGAPPRPPGAGTARLHTSARPPLHTSTPSYLSSRSRAQQAAAAAGPHASPSPGTPSLRPPAPRSISTSWPPPRPPPTPSSEAIMHYGTLHMTRTILREEGFRGLYRGFGISVASTVPTSAVWWGSYGLFQQLIWNLLSQRALQPLHHSAAGEGAGAGASPGGAAAQAPPASPSLGSASPSLGPASPSLGSSTALLQAARSHPVAGSPAGGPAGGAAGGGPGGGSGLDVILVQTLASLLAGVTSAGVTTPLDLVKTRIQVARKQDGQASTFRAVVSEVLREEGWAGFFRGSAPRMLSSALWGTTMVTVYEWLKRMSLKE